MSRSNLYRTACLLASLLATACSQGSAPSSNSVAPGTLLQNPSSADGFTYLLAGANFNGGASNLRVERVLWGRLVDLYSQEQSGRKKLIRDLLVRQDLQSDGEDYLLESNPITMREELTILHPFETPEFDTAFQPLRDEVGLEEFIDKGLSANVLPPFTAVPRNAGVVVEFNDLLDPETVHASNIKVLVGYPPTAPFEARIVPDRSRGGIVDGVQYSTRVIVDPTVSPGDAQSMGLSVNARGFPAANSALLINAGLRIPTKVNQSAAQFDLLRNLAGKPLTLSDNGSADAGSPTLDVVRGFRTGGPTLATSDEFNGYLYDVDPPEVMGTLGVTIADATGPISPDQFLATLTFDALACAIQPRLGDILTANNGVYEVVSVGDPLAGATVADVGLLWIAENVDSAAPQLGSAELRTPWDSTLGMTPGCFVTFDGPATTPPVTGVPTTASVRVTFSEPMDPDKVNAFDGIKIGDPSVASAQVLKKTVVGKMAASESLLSFILQPSMPFKHVQGGSETFNLNVISFTDPLTNLTFGVTDLAGNPLSDLLPQVQFTLKSTDPTLKTGGISLRFNSTNEDGDAANAPEVRGQIVPDLLRGVMLPRAVTRFSSFMDTSTFAAPTVQAMTPIPTGAVEPLSIYGCRLQTVWRYVDMGLDLDDDPFLNIDVEGLAWMVSGSGVAVDNFPEFEMALAHSDFAPDEYVNPMSGQVQFPASGLSSTFANNVAEADGLAVVSPQTEGYLVQSIDQFQTPSNSLMMPYPLNRNKPVSEFSYFTWRDTTKLDVGGANSGGVPPGSGLPGTYPGGSVPTIGLPLLMDFKTFPAPTTAQGTNVLALAGVNFGANLPFFRAFSAGGIDASQQQVLVDPASEITAKVTDSGFYYGNADFVTRVAVMHTIWFDTGAISSFNEVVALPPASQVPAGLEMHFAFRGATALTGSTTAAANANNYDPYGNAKPPANAFGATFLNGDATWKDDIGELDGAKFIQIRVTFVANADTGAVPELDAIGFAYSED